MKNNHPSSVKVYQLPFEKAIDVKKLRSCELTVSDPLNSQRWAQRKMSEKSK